MPINVCVYKHIAHSVLNVYMIRKQAAYVYCTRNNHGNMQLPWFAVTHAWTFLRVLLLMKKDLSLSCKASRRALTTTPPDDWRPDATFSSTIDKHAGTEYNRILTANIFLSMGRCDRTGNKQLTGSLQQIYSHSWQQLAVMVWCSSDSVWA